MAQRPNEPVGEPPQWRNRFGGTEAQRTRRGAWTELPCDERPLKRTRQTPCAGTAESKPNPQLELASATSTRTYVRVAMEGGYYQKPVF